MVGFDQAHHVTVHPLLPVHGDGHVWLLHRHIQPVSHTHTVKHRETSLNTRVTNMLTDRHASSSLCVYVKCAHRTGGVENTHMYRET